MRAVVIDEFNTPGVLREVAEPALGSNDVAVSITVAGINPIDWKIRSGEAGKRPLPMTLGQDFAGVVLRTGAGVRSVKTGDRVFGVARDHGAYAEETVIREGQQDSPFSLIPDGVTDEVAGAVPTPCLTALGSLEILEVQRGTKLLVVGAAGSVGGAAVQMARERGAVITAVVLAGQEAGASDFGASDIATSIGALISRGGVAFDAVLDTVSKGDELKKNVALVRKGGALVTTIHVADEPWFRERGITATNIVMNQTPQSSPQGLNEVAQMIAAGKLKIQIAAEKPLSEAPTLLDELSSGKLHGKIVLKVSS
jgi:NADPH:quinone reductase-like Zn-dependent oxidoreductase